MRKTSFLYASIVVSAIALLLAGLALKSRFDQGSASRKSLIAKNHNQDDALRTFLCLFQDTVLANPELPPKKRDFTVAFFAKVTNKIHVPPCPVGGS
jgi:hypothetical protein